MASVADGAGTSTIATAGGGYIGQQSGSTGAGLAIPSGTAYRAVGSS